MTSSTSLAARRPRRGTASADAEPAPLPALLPSSTPTPVADGDGSALPTGDGVASSSPLLDGRVPSSTAAAVAPLSVADAGAEAAAVAAVVNMRILPVFVAFTAVNYLDRTAVAFAAPGLKASLPLTDSQFGLGSSLFFLPYCLAQCPLVAAALSTIGPVPTLVTCCLAWGGCAAATAFVVGPRSFYAARIALGVAEAATFPMMWALLASFSATPGHLAASYAVVTATIAAAQVLGGPVAAILLSLDGLAGLAGWQIIFLFEAAPTLVVALWAHRSLPRSPATALPPDARTWLVARQRAGIGGTTSANRDDRWAALRQPRLWALGCLEAVVSVAKFALLFFTPLLVDAVLTGAAVRHAGVGHAPPLPAHRAAAVAALTAIPFGLAAAATIANAAHAKRTRERRWHVVWPIAACAAGLGGLAFTLPRSAPGALASLTVGAQVYVASGVVSSYPASMLGPGGAAAPVGYAFANALAAAGGVAGPAAFGALRDVSGGYTLPCAVMAGVAACAAAAYAIVLPWLDEGGGGGSGTAAGCEGGGR